MSLFDGALNIYTRLRAAQQNGELAHLEPGKPLILSTDMYVHGVDYAVTISIDRANPGSLHDPAKDGEVPVIPPVPPTDPNAQTPPTNPNSW